MTTSDSSLRSAQTHCSVRKINIAMITDYELRLALQQRMQGFKYSELELVNWLCTTFDITVERSTCIVQDVCSGL